MTNEEIHKTNLQAEKLFARALDAKTSEKEKEDDFTIKKSEWLDWRNTSETEKNSEKLK